MEDYIFLIIAVVISIFGALNKNKKKGAIESPVAEKEGETENYFMDKFFNVDIPDYQDEEEPVPAKIRIAPKKKPLNPPAPLIVKTNQRPAFKSTLPDPSGRVIQSALKKETVMKDDIEIETGESTDYLEDFSLRKAFIYSEIMNPKYVQQSGS